MKFGFSFLFLAAALHAAVQLPTVISDNMVLQQGAPVRIWGKADPSEEVRVSMLGQTRTARANADGRWQLWLSPMAAGGPHELTINSITLRNILIGEVWVASGQSNMVWNLRVSKNGAEEAARANFPSIRFFQVKTTVADSPLDDCEGASWKVLSPETAPTFAGVAFFFAKALYAARGVPVGILWSAVGGTPAQAWISREGLEANKMLDWYRTEWDKRVAEWPAAKPKFEAQLAEWKSRSAAGKQAAAAPRAPAGSPGHTHTPNGLYNGMIAPISPYSIKGAIWYQGEANAGSGDAELYRHLFSDMILDWRRVWGQGAFPFLWVQLAGFEPPPGRHWPVIRDSQTAALALANTGQALAIDVGETKDIHPKDKQTVGNRLALAARAVAYGENIVYSGPRFRQLTREGAAIRVWFDHTGSGLARKGGPLSGFRIAGDDGRFFKAEARLSGNTVLVSSPLVSDPVAVRYAWENDPVANLVNREGLPAVPFRTDTWQ